MRGLRRYIAPVILFGALLKTFGADSMPLESRTFIQNHCAECHDGEVKKAGLDLTALAYEPEDKANIGIWVKVHDRVEAGEMPPKKKSRPDPLALDTFVKTLTSTLKASETSIISRDGRAMQRRLNRYEYANVLEDLFHIPWAQLRNKLPDDGEAYRFNKSGEALDVSHVQISRYMSVSDYAMRQAMSVQLEHPPTITNRYYARSEPSLVGNFRPTENGTLPDRHSFPVLDSHAQPDVRAGRLPVSDPSTRDREAVGHVCSIFSDAGSYSWGQFRAPVSGKYRLRFSGYSIWVSGGGIGRWFYEGQGAEKAPVYHLPLWHRPNADEVWPGRQDEPMGVYAQSSGQSRPLGQFDFSPQPSTHEIEVVLNANEVVQTDDLRLFRTRVNGTDEQYVNPLAQKDGLPGYAIQWMEVEGPLYDPSGAQGYKLLFSDLPLKRLEAGATGVMLDVSIPAGQPLARGGRGGRFAPRTKPVPVEILSEEPLKDAERLLRSFMRRVYRRPVEEAHVRRFLDLFNDQFNKGFGFGKSMLSTYTAVLSSPGFIFTDEKPGRLDDYALASRLSFFLWNSEPDETLRALASRGELHKPEVLRVQTDRLLNDLKSKRFIEAFTDYWLDLRKIDDTSPSTTLYNDYELDDPLKLASIEETQLFFNEMLHSDLPVRNIIDSDFTFLNEHLANHYGISGVKGGFMRKVTIPGGSVRGGLLTQASILKVTANGTTTSPVLRGYWITERIMGHQIPPPPPVASVEPDIRGAVTLRQQLEKHRNNASCAVCHSKMDPPGFALESFDVMGGWRDRYRAVKDGVAPEKGFGLNGQAFAFYYGLPVDAAGELPDGRKFSDIRDFKRLLLQDEIPLARNMVRQLTIYATGAPLRFTDREQVEKIVQGSSSHQYGLRTILHGIVQSDLFQMK
ncbi:MAG: hypothetical protein JWN25_199 [Verrucomicrobiales bacterium]|nr:hypothetical protein [Verrucomicrobiales bacterium]